MVSRILPLQLDRNNYPGWCGRCQSPIPSQAGWLWNRNPNTHRWSLRCETCLEEIQRFRDQFCGESGSSSTY